MRNPRYTIGLDFGTGSVRCLVVRIEDGAEVGSAVHPYHHGNCGVYGDASGPELARQHPADYIEGLTLSVTQAMACVRDTDRDFATDRIVGVGVDTTGSTPIPVDSDGTPLAFQPAFAENINAFAWLWKDHTSKDEARMITDRALESHAEYLAKCGGVYSSEWYWAKIWHCANVDTEVSRAASAWVEFADWLPAILSGRERNPSRGICPAGHKAMYHESWGGYPSRDFLASLHPELARARNALEGCVAVSVDTPAGYLTPEWAAKLGIRADLPISTGAFDAHIGAIACGIRPGVMIKVLGTSGCDMMVEPLSHPLKDIPGLCGIVPGSILPGHHGLEAGQAALGDLYGWWVDWIKPDRLTHEELTRKAVRLKPGETGLLALDWNNGNRTVIVDQHLTGLLVGQTLRTLPEEVYRALIEATAFGAKIILNRFEEYGVKVEEIITTGGVAHKNPFILQIYADVMERPVRIARSDQACALGAAIVAAVISGAHPDFPSAQKVMGGVETGCYLPQPENVLIYRELFQLYKDMHDAFGTSKESSPLRHVMKRLIKIREETRSC